MWVGHSCPTPLTLLSPGNPNMKFAGINIQHAKLRGEWAELLFMARAAEHGLAIVRPWGDSAAYDVGLVLAAKPEARPLFLRVQVKSTKCKHGNSYQCQVASNGVPYRLADLDFIAAYVIPVAAWYIIPIAATNHQPVVLLSPHRPKSKYAKYQEAWHLLRNRDDNEL